MFYTSPIFCIFFKICVIYRYLYSSQVICFYVGFWTPLRITLAFFKLYFALCNRFAINNFFFDSKTT